MQIFHRRHPYGARKTIEKRRTRQRRFGGEFGNGPRMGRRAMDLPDRRRQPRIAEAAEQSRPRVATLDRAQRLDDQHLDEP